MAMPLCIWIGIFNHYRTLVSLIASLTTTPGNIEWFKIELQVRFFLFLLCSNEIVQKTLKDQINALTQRIQSLDRIDSDRLDKQTKDLDMKLI